MHFTRQIQGGVECGPNACCRARGVPAHGLFAARHAGDDDLSGFLRFFVRYPRMCWEEYKRSYSKKLFCRSFSRLCDSMTIEDLGAGGAGVRAQALSPSGELSTAGFLLCAAGGRTPRAECAEPRGDGVAGDCGRQPLIRRERHLRPDSVPGAQRCKLTNTLAGSPRRTGCVMSGRGSAW